MKLLSRMIAKADKCIGNEDTVQVSEKLYKVKGFHEARLDIEEVKIRVNHVRVLVSVVEKWGF